MLFKTFPEVLAVNCRRFELVNWVPTKLDVPVVVGDEPFIMDAYLSKGPAPDEDLMAEGTESSAPSFVPNEGAMADLEGMGFPRLRCEKALYKTGNSGSEAAMNWLFEHMEDADIDEPLVLEKPKAGGAEPSAEQIEMLGAMGFTASQAKKALRETGGDMERAVEWVFSHPDDMGEDDDQVMAGMTEQPKEKEIPGRADTPAEFQLNSIVCHKGSSIHAGHYVAFVKKVLKDEGDAWVLFNDEKVVKAVDDVEEMKKFAYVYFFKRNN